MNDNQLSRYELIESGIFNLYKEERYLLFRNNKNIFNVNEYPTFSNDDSLKCNFDECVRMYNAISKRKSRVFKKMLYWFYYISKNDDKNLIFGTLTFRDDVLLSTSKETRRRYIARFLNTNTLHYVANIDYGKTTDREHYHFIALVDHNIEKDKWRYGFSLFNKIKKNTSLRNRKNYLMKITNHTYKDSTKQEKIITDRIKDKSLVVFICSNRNDFEIFKDKFYLDLQTNKRGQ